MLIEIILLKLEEGSCIIILKLRKLVFPMEILILILEVAGLLASSSLSIKKY
jgi:hypothetical protein